MAGKKVGSDGQIRKTTAEWAADTDTYPEGMRLMDTETGSVRVSKGTTYALAWTPSTGGAATWGTITGTLSDQTDLQNQLETQANAIGLKEDAVPTYVAKLSQTGTSAPVATVLMNTLGGTVVWSRGTAGTYLATLAGAFVTSDRTFILLDYKKIFELHINEAITVDYTRIDADTIQITFSDSSDDWMSEWYFEIKVYPAP